MHDDFASLFDYNHWANLRLVDACLGLTAEQYAAEPVPGWSSIRATLVHLAVATDAWLHALAGGSGTSPILSEADLPAVADVARLLDSAHTRFQDLSPRLSAEWLSTPLTLTRGSRSVTVPPWVVLRHVVNHATYHRGQIAAKLGRLEVAVPPTDLIYWAFERFPQP